jgi:RNA polymerase sigma factor (sigma-70 family)
MSLDVAAVYGTHHAAVLRYVRRHLVGVDDAVIEDLVADVWERVVRSAPRYQDRGAPIVAWLLGIARNLLTDHYRKWSPRGADDRHRRRARKATVHAFGDIEAFVTQVGTDRHAMMIDTRCALAALPERQRLVIIGRFYEGRMHREMGHLSTLDGSKKIQDRAIVNLRKALEAVA